MEINFKLTIIIPCYGVAKWLSASIESVVSNTYKNIEIVLVDDGSKDGCSKIIDEWAEKDIRIKPIHKENGGLVTAIKAGLNESTGDFVGLLSGDDYVSIDYYEKVANAIIEAEEKSDDGIDIFYPGGLVEHYLDGNSNINYFNIISDGIYNNSDDRGKFVKWTLMNESFKNSIAATNGLWFARREFYQEVMKLVENGVDFSDDLTASIAATSQAKAIAINNSLVGVHYRILNTSRSHAYQPTYWEKTEIMCKNLDSIIKNGNFENDKELIKKLNIEKTYHIYRVINQEISDICGRRPFERGKLLNQISANSNVGNALKNTNILSLRIPYLGKTALILIKQRCSHLLVFLYLLKQYIKKMILLVKHK